MSEGSAADRAVVSKLARGSLLSRLKHGRQPLKLVAVPRDHVQGDRQRGEALMKGQLAFGNDSLSLKELDFSAVGTRGAILRCFESSRRRGWMSSPRCPRCPGACIG